jgi:hypothetical protein
MPRAAPLCFLPFHFLLRRPLFDDLSSPCTVRNRTTFADPSLSSPCNPHPTCPLSTCSCAFCATSSCTRSSFILSYSLVFSPHLQLRNIRHVLLHPGGGSGGGSGGSSGSVRSVGGRGGSGRGSWEGLPDTAGHWPAGHRWAQLWPAGHSWSLGGGVQTHNTAQHAVHSDTAQHAAHSDTVLLSMSSASLVRDLSRGLPAVPPPTPPPHTSRPPAAIRVGPGLNGPRSARAPPPPPPRPAAVSVRAKSSRFPSGRAGPGRAPAGRENSLTTAGGGPAGAEWPGPASGPTR